MLAPLGGFLGRPDAPAALLMLASARFSASPAHKRWQARAPRDTIGDAQHATLCAVSLICHRRPRGHDGRMEVEGAPCLSFQQPRAAPTTDLGALLGAGSGLQGAPQRTTAHLPLVGGPRIVAHPMSHHREGLSDWPFASGPHFPARLSCAGTKQA